MLNRYLTFYKPAIQFIVFCALLAMSVMVGGYLFGILMEKATGMTLIDINNLKEIPTTLGHQFKKINSLVLAVTLLMPACFFAYLAYPEPSKYLGLTSKVKKHHWLWAITLLAIALPFTSLLEEWNQLIPAIGDSKALDEQYNRLAKSMLSGNTFNDLLSNVFYICIAPALIEEVLFRGCLQRILLNWMQKTPLTAILIVAILFSAFHGQLSGFFPRLFLGILLGLAYYYSGSLWISIFMHFLNNFLTVFLMYLYQAKITSIDMNQLPPMNLYFGIASGVAVIGMLYYFYKDRIPYQEIEVEKDEIKM